MNIFDPKNSNVLLGLGAGLLTGAAPGGTFGAGLSRGLLNMQAAGAAAMQNKMMQMQMEEYQRKQALDREQRQRWTQAVGAPAQQTQYQMSEAELFPGEQQLGGLLNQTPATGMYAQNPQMAEALGLLGPDVGREVYGKALLSQMEPQDPTTAQQNLMAMGLTPGTPEFASAMQQYMFKPDNVINMGAGDVVSKDEALALVDPQGNHPTPGTSWPEVRQGGYQWASTNQQTQSQGAQGALSFIDQLESLAFNEQNPLFKDYDGLIERAKVSGGNIWDYMTQQDGGKNLALYKDLADSGISIIVRSLGEKGTLAEGDIRRIKNSLPQVYPLPDKPDVARKKLQTLRQIIKDVSNRKDSVGQRYEDARVVGDKTYVSVGGKWYELEGE